MSDKELSFPMTLIINVLARCHILAPRETKLAFKIVVGF